MGNSSSKGPFDVSKATIALHAAIQAWNVDDVRRILSSDAADAWAFRILTKEERVAIWRPKAHTSGTSYAVNAVGKFMSELYLSIQAADAHVAVPPFTPALLRDMFGCLLAARGVDVNGVIERYGTDASLSRGDTTCSDALRMMVLTAPDASMRRKRASLLLPLLHMLMDAGTVSLSCDDLIVWSNAGGDAALPRLASVDAVALCDAEGVKSQVRLHPLLVAVDLNLLPVVRAVCTASPASVAVSDSDGVTALMRCTGEHAPVATAAAVVAQGDDRRRTVALVEALLAAGADVHACDKLGRTALHHFAGATVQRLESSARRFVCLRLLRAGADIAAKAHDGSTAVSAARDRGDAALADTLIREAAWMRRTQLVAFHSRAAAAS